MSPLQLPVEELFKHRFAERRFVQQMNAATDRADSLRANRSRIPWPFSIPQDKQREQAAQELDREAQKHADSANAHVDAERKLQSAMFRQHRIDYHLRAGTVLLMPAVHSSLIYALRRTYGTPFGFAEKTRQENRDVRLGEPLISFDRPGAPEILSPVNGTVLKSGIEELMTFDQLRIQPAKFSFAVAIKLDSETPIDMRVVHQNIRNWLTHIHNPQMLRPEDDSDTRNRVVEMVNHWMDIPPKLLAGNYYEEQLDQPWDMLPDFSPKLQKLAIS